MNARPLFFASLTLLATACSSAPELDPAPPLEGMGVQVLQESTDSRQAQTPSTELPIFQTGMEFVYLRGGDRLAQFQVVYDPEMPLVRMVDTDTRMETWYDLELAELGRALPNGAAPILRLLPGDAWVHFPLGPGKRWRSEFAHHSPGREAAMFVANYHCEAWDSIETPAGQFDCLRIVRLAGLAGDESGRRRTSIYWYAPELGFVLRRIDNSQLLELQSFGLAETPLEFPQNEVDPPTQSASGSEEVD